MNEEKIIGKLLEHDAHFERVDARLDNIDIRLDKMTGMLIKHDSDIEYIKENMSTKKDICDIHDTLDVLVKLAQKRDEESTMMSYRIQEHDKKIKTIKSTIGLT